MVEVLWEVNQATWASFSVTCLVCIVLVIILLLLNSACKLAAEANSELEAEWDKTLERLGTADCLKASDDMVIERCGAEAATSLLCSKYITTILLPVALAYGMLVLIPAHLHIDSVSAFGDIPFRVLTIHETLSSDIQASGGIVWLHVGFQALVMAATVHVTLRLLENFHLYFQVNRRWCRSSLARRSLRIDGVEEGLPCPVAAAKLSTKLSDGCRASSRVQNRDICNSWWRGDQAESDPAITSADLITDIQVVPDQREYDRLMTERQNLLLKQYRRMDQGFNFTQSSSATMADHEVGSHRLEAIDKQLALLAVQGTQATSSSAAFITFSTIEQAETFVKHLSADNFDLAISKAPEPSDIIWKNMNTQGKQNTKLRLVFIPGLLLLLLVVMMVPMACLLGIRDFTTTIPGVQVLPAVAMSLLNLWLLPVVIYRLCLWVGHDKISSLEKQFLLTYTIAMLASSLLLPATSIVLCQLGLNWFQEGTFVAPSLQTLTWISSPAADAFYADYLVMSMVVLAALQLLQLQRQSTTTQGTSALTAEECEMFFSTGRNAYFMPTYATDTKGYQYAVYTHIFYITCGFGGRAPCIVLFGALISGIKYFSDKVAQFRFFSDPVAQMQVRPRFLRRGGQYVTLTAIKCLALTPVVCQLLLAAVLVSYEPLPMLSDMGLWCVVMMGAVQVLAWGMFVVSLNADLDTLDSSSSFSQHYDHELAISRVGGQETYQRPAPTSNHDSLKHLSHYQQSYDGL